MVQQSIHLKRLVCLDQIWLNRANVFLGKSTHLSSNINKVATVNSHFGVWLTHKPIMTDAKTTDLASILLLASLHNRNVHTYHKRHH